MHIALIHRESPQLTHPNRKESLVGGEGLKTLHYTTSEEKQRKTIRTPLSYLASLSSRAQPRRERSPVCGFLTPKKPVICGRQFAVAGHPNANLRPRRNLLKGANLQDQEFFFGDCFVFCWYFTQMFLLARFPVRFQTSGMIFFFLCFFLFFFNTHE